MHSRIIALNVRTNEDEVFEYMNGIADYVDDRGQDDDWGLEILERIGTVDREAHTFRPDREKVIERLEAAYNYYQEQEIDSFASGASSENSRACVSGSAMPVASSSAAFWNFFTAVSVILPYDPSAAPSLRNFSSISRFCRALTSSP